MVRIESNLESVVVRFQQNIRLAEYNLTDYLKRAGIDAVVLVAHRVQMKGLNSDGSRLQTKSRLRQGAYSKAHAKLRAMRGRQIDQVDLTLNGDLLRNWQVLNLGSRIVTVGFLDDRQADIAEYLEAYYGDIFSLSDTEQQQVVDALSDSILDDLTQ